MAAPKKSPLCSECGAVLSAGPARCPLCGAEPKSASKPSRPAVYDRDKYQEAIRNLRKQLKDLRDDEAEAV